MANEILVEMPLGGKLQLMRCKVLEANPRKTGYNPYGKFNYFKLNDFLPIANQIMKEMGMWSEFSIRMVGDVEYAVLNICDTNQQITFMLPTAEANNSQNPIQNAGSKNTYMKRYCWMNALELEEDDTVDAATGSPEDKKVNLATKFQVDKLSQYKDKLINEFKALNVKSVNDLKQLTVEQASSLLEKLEEKLRAEE